jgi:hypothetical protein
MAFSDKKMTGFDGFVKIPSAALRFNFVVAAHLVSALHSSVFARLASGAFYETIVLVTFYEIISVWGQRKSLLLTPGPFSIPGFRWG